MGGSGMTKLEQRHKDKAYELMREIVRGFALQRGWRTWLEVVLAEALAEAEEDGFEAARETVGDWYEPGEPWYVH